MPTPTTRIGIALLFVTASAVSFSHLIAEGNPARNAEVLNQYELPPTSLTNFGYTQSELDDAEPFGLTVDDQPAIGSGLIALGGDHYLGITDRGPNIDHLPTGVPDEPTVNCVPTGAGSDGKTHPLPQFTPAIVKFKVHGGTIEIENIVNLVGTGGVGITGLSNITGSGNTFDDPSYLNPCTATSTVNVNGMDVEDFALLPNGKFIGVEENRPSVFIGDLQTGLIEKRFIPRTQNLPGTLYTVNNDTLPEVLKRRSKNRGFESIAVSPDQKTAFTMSQSPLEVGCLPATSTCRNNRILRIIKLDIADPYTIAVTGQYLYKMSDPAVYPAGTPSRALKLSAMAWVGPNKLLLLERSDDPGMGGVQLVLVDLENADDVNGLYDTALTPEENGGAGKTLVARHVVFEEFEDQPVSERHFWTYKLEGLAIRNANSVDITNDNDFGIIGDPNNPPPSQLWTLKLGEPLPLGK